MFGQLTGSCSDEPRGDKSDLLLRVTDLVSIQVIQNVLWFDGAAFAEVMRR